MFEDANPYSVLPKSSRAAEANSHSRCVEGRRGPPRAAVVVVAVPPMRPWLTHVHALFPTEGRCAPQNVLGRRRGTCHADGVPRTRLLAPVEVEFPWVFVAASGATVHGAIVHSNAKVFLVVIRMPFRSDAETDWIQWYDRHDYCGGERKGRWINGELRKFTETFKGSENKSSSKQPATENTYIYRNQLHPTSNLCTCEHINMCTCGM